MTALEFWGRPYTWPHDPRGYVFLARAVEEIGGAIFGQDWTGKEVTTEYVRSLPPQWQATQGDASYARHVLMKLPKPAKQLPTPEALPPSLNSPARLSRWPGIIRPDSFTGGQWSAAQAAVHRQQQERAPALQRLSTVQMKIVELCESGELTSAIRHTAGGTMTNVPRDWWNTEQWRNRFVCCQLKPSDPFGIGFAGDNYCWIFLTRESLDRYLQRASPPSTAGREKAAISELKRMLEANANLPRDEAQNLCKSKFRIGPRGFQRIWPKAREAAGLSPVAPPGRKPRQPSR